MADVILQWQLASTRARFPHALKTVTLLFHITQFLALAIMQGVIEYNYKYIQQTMWDIKIWVKEYEIYYLNF